MNIYRRVALSAVILQYIFFNRKNQMFKLILVFLNIYYHRKLQCIPGEV